MYKDYQLSESQARGNGEVSAITGSSPQQEGITTMLNSSVVKKDFVEVLIANRTLCLILMINFSKKKFL